MKKFLFVILLLPLIVSAQTAKDYVEQGKALYKAWRSRPLTPFRSLSDTTVTDPEQNGGVKAVMLFTKAIALDPDYIEAYKERARAAEYGLPINFNRMPLDDYKSLIADYTAIIRLAPGDTTYYYKRALAEGMHKDYDDAISDYKKLLTLNPKSAQALTSMTFALDVMPDHTRAVQEYTALISSGKKYYFNRGQARYKMKDYKSAINDYKEALKIARDSTRILISLGSVYTELGNYKAAIDCYTQSLNSIGKRILSFAPDNAAGFYARRANAEVLARDYKSALADYDKVVALRPITRWYNLRGEARYKAGNKIGACNDWNEAYKLGSRAVIYADSVDRRGRQQLPILVDSRKLDLFDTVGLKATVLNRSKYCK